MRIIDIAVAVTAINLALNNSVAADSYYIIVGAIKRIAASHLLDSYLVAGCVATICVSAINLFKISVVHIYCITGSVAG